MKISPILTLNKKRIIYQLFYFLKNGGHHRKTDIIILFFNFVIMFKGKVYLYRKEGEKEEKIEKDFNNEKDFNAYIDKNPDLKTLREFKWEPIKWPALSGFDDFLKDMKGSTFLKEIEKDINKMEKDMELLFNKSRKLLK